MPNEVLIVGGGVIGLSIARELSLRGVRGITLIEKGVCGEEASWAAAGMLGPQAEADERGPLFDMQCESRDLYPKLAESLAEDTGIDIELDRTGTLYIAFSEPDADHLTARFQWQKNAGLPVESLDPKEIKDAEPAVSTAVMALRFPGDWQVGNRKLIDALKKYAELNRIEIRERTAVEQLVVKDGVVVGVKTRDGLVTAGTVVLAAGAWSSKIMVGNAGPPFLVEPVRGQIVAVHAVQRFFRHVIYCRRGYMVPRALGRILIGSTSENVGFDRSTTSEAYKSLREMAAEVIPATAELPAMDHWSGLRPRSPDGLPVIGELTEAKGVFAATAHFRNGILLAPLTARIIADLIIDKRRSRYVESFGPSRYLPESAGNASAN